MSHLGRQDSDLHVELVVAFPGDALCTPRLGTDGGPDLQGQREILGSPLTLLPRPPQECLSRLLSPCGPVQSVELQEKPDLTESAKEPKSKFFHPRPVPVSLRVLGSAGMGACGGARAVSPVCEGKVV